MFWLFLIPLSLSHTSSWEIPLPGLGLYPSEPFTNNLVAIADDSTMVFCDRQAGRLIFTDSDGTVQATFGQKGQGPGEFFSIDGT